MLILCKGFSFVIRDTNACSGNLYAQQESLVNHIWQLIKPTQSNNEKTYGYMGINFVCICVVGVSQYIQNISFPFLSFFFFWWGECREGLEGVLETTLQ